jgi:predicted acetyltransferase
MNESADEIYQAMPWLEIEEPLPSQVEHYLWDVQRYGEGGLSYHWAIISSGEFAGLIALDHVSTLIVGHWNLGYWIRRSCQRKRLASQSIDGVLNWLGRGGLTSVEMAVSRDNIAGVRTVESAIRRWAGHPLDEQIETKVGGQIVSHDCWLIPRIPLGDSQ